MSNNVIYTLSKKFALRIVKLYNYLYEQKKEYVMSKQLYRCGTSIGANLSESIYAQSEADYISKLKIALKEASETKYWLELLFEAELLKKNEFDYYFSESVLDKTIFISGLGRSVRGSMQYLLNELNSNDLYKDYTIYVRTAKSTDAVVRDYIEQNGWTRTKAVSKGFARYMESCKYLITESYFPYTWIRRPGQVMIDLWHGTPLKRLGVLKSGDKCHKTAIQQKNFLSADYLLYPNDFTRDVMWRSYGITSLLSAKAVI